ncbi:hypothetical protein WR164_03150 [Philodulcilactobacillus myokoensis]|uniref:DUF4097 domain-containing protein n=1 Tax=Philodulcilactobacillus myokoensis TaxID=2929573 RepID=A0A9W6B0I9_9LACO|nr:DUF4097 family beta strand repeat-containing protein [Philodulcilactobacillus myokoensis]GLB46336.1 hypothetical protein WR164_03150 [Philodulcilactobacillus myokoensis]
MNKIMKFLLYSGLGFLVVGLVLMFIGKVGHGYQGLNRLSNYEYVPSVSNPSKGKTTFDNVNAFNINAGIPVTIQSGNVKKTEVVVNSSQKNSGVQLKRDGQKLNIMTKKSKLRNDVHISFHNFLIGSGSGSGNGYPTNSKVTITVPKNETIKSVNQVKRGGALHLSNVHIGAINSNGISDDNNFDNVTSNHPIKLREVKRINKVTAPSLDIDDYKNDFNITNSSFTKQASTINVHSDDVDLKHNRWNNLMLISNDGYVYFNDQTTENNLTIQNNSGDITGHIKPSKHNIINTSTKSGDNNVYSHNDFVNVKPSYHYNFSTNGGDINIKK